MRLMPTREHRDGRQRLGLRGVEAVDRDLDDHAAADRRALHLRRLDPAGLRLRDHGRDRRRRRLDDLHRDAAPLEPARARPGVRGPPRRGLRREDPRQGDPSRPSAPPPTRRRRCDADGRDRARPSASPATAARARMRSASAAASGDSRGRMDDPGNDLFDERDPLDRLLAHARAEARRDALALRRGDARAGAATRSASARGHGSG